MIVFAQEEARTLTHGYIGPEHILLGLIHEGEGVAAKRQGCLPETIRSSAALVC